MSLLAHLLGLDFLLNRLADGHLGSTLADLGQVGARVAGRRLCEVRQVDFRREGRLAQTRLEDVCAIQGAAHD